MNSFPLTRRFTALQPLETPLLIAVLALMLLALAGPFVAQAASYHGFADHRALGGLPFAMDVLSNLGFVAGGLAGLAMLRSAGSPRDGVQRPMAVLFFAGLLVTALGSVAYHWQPQDSGLAWDRLGMVLPFAGLLGLAAAGRVSPRAGVALAAAVLLLAPAAVATWAQSGNLLAWVVLQAGGMVLILGLACLAPLPGAWPVRWAGIIAVYALAKILELGDHAVYEATAHLVSGHSLKHLLAACAAWPVMAALRRQQTAGHA